MAKRRGALLPAALHNTVRLLGRHSPEDAGARSQKLAHQKTLVPGVRVAGAEFGTAVWNKNRIAAILIRDSIT
jgi:hypothetical protein